MPPEPARPYRMPFRERWLLAWADFAERRGRPAKAWRRLMKLEAIRPLALHELAFKALLLLQTGAPERAHDLFIEVREAAMARDDPEHHYIRRFAQSWLAAIRMDPFDATTQDRAAAKIACAPRLKRFLSLPSGEPRPSALDEEFDAWMKANAPTETDLRKRRV